MGRRLELITDVAAHHLCSGCGACASVDAGITMSDVPSEGLRPFTDGPVDHQAALAVCPGVTLEHAAPPAGADEQLAGTWGPVLAIWEGHAADPDLRFAASSGGAATALAAFTLDHRGHEGVVHIGARADEPWRNETVTSRSPDELLAHTGSRYAPASPADGLGALADSSAPWTFIGKPCDVAGARRVGEAQPRIGDHLGLTIAIFCAGTPSTDGTLAMLETMGVQPDETVVAVRYRGEGWPGTAKAVVERDGVQTTSELTYQESWGDVLTQHVPWRCRICPDHTGEFADVSVGDPWYRSTEGDPGSSLIIARTERGRAAVEAAIDAGVLVAGPVDPDLLPRSQPNLERARGAVWGRLVAMRALRMPTPRFGGLPMAGIWWRRLTVAEKARSLFGTGRRIVTRRLRHPSADYLAHHSSRRR